MPPKHKNKSANPRDRRHENGLAPPAKQIKKQKSDNQLNGHAFHPAQSSNNVAPASSVDNPSAFAEPDGTSNIGSAMHAPLLSTIEPQSSHASAATSTKVLNMPGAAQSAGVPTLKTPDATDSFPSQSFAASFADKTNTVIAELSILDVVAILLVLMQLPYSVLWIIQVCFAFLTFGSPPNGWSLSSILHDLSQSHGGSASVLTMLSVDFLCGIAYMLPIAPKNFPLDLAQAVVAVSLGGGSSGRHVNSQSVLCFAVVATHHLLGQKLWSIRYQTLSGLCWLVNLATASTMYGPLEPEDILDHLDVSPDSNRNWFRRILELHILSQGILKIIRRTLIHSGTARRGESDPGYIPPGSPTVVTNNANLDAGRNTSSDGRQPGPSPAARDGTREKSFSLSKRKKRQATFVKSQQPFWAAIANTKVTLLKDLEHSETSQDSFEAGSSGPGSLGSSIRQCAHGCVYITSITDTEVRFKAVHVQDGTPSGKEEPQTSATEALDEPTIAVRVNGAEWSSTALVSDGTKNGKTLLKGDIFGLTSLTNYKIEFYDPSHDILLHAVTLLTRPDATVDSAPVDGSFRPSSPTSTLKKSIAAQEATLSEHRNRSKKAKKGRQNAITNLKKDIGKSESHLSSTGGSDEKSRQRSIQLTQSIKQAETAAETLAQDAADLGEVPRAQHQAAAASKEKWATQKEAHNSLKSELDRTKSENSKRVKGARTETTQLQQKQDRLNARLNKLNIQRDGLIAANERDQQDQKRRDQTRMTELARAADEERRLGMQLRNLDNQRAQHNEQCAELEQRLQYMENGYIPSMTGGEFGVPQTPEGSYSNLAFNSTRPPPGLGNLPAFQQPIGTPPVHSRRASLFKQNRQRSSSMLSNVSGFTDDEIGSGQQPSNGVHPPSHGSAGSSGGSQRPGSASRPDTTSPAPSKLSPIGAEIGRNSPRNAKN